jgi:hypothetical protein
MDGGTIGQIRGAQIGSISSELLHSAWTSPSTHRHTHEAPACEPGKSSDIATNANRGMAMMGSSNGRKPNRLRSNSAALILSGGR